MSDAANRVVESLNSDIGQELSFNENKTPGLVPEKYYDKVSFTKDEKTGKFSKNVERVETEIKDNVTEINTRIEELQREVLAYTDLAGISDRALYDNISAINQKKQEIANIITNNCGICSCVVGTASSGGVIIGIGSYIHADRITISSYQNLSNYESDQPFSSDVQVDLTEASLGKGYQTNSLEINYLTDDQQAQWEDTGVPPVGYGLYSTITGFLADGITPSATCAGAASSIANLFSEISNHREQISNRTSFREESNSIKDKKTEKELELWSLLHDVQSMTSLANSDTAVRNAIINQPLYGYKGSSSGITVLPFSDKVALGQVTIGTYVPEEGGFYIGTMSYTYSSWEPGYGTSPTYYIFIAPKASGESSGQYKTTASCDGAESTQTSAQSTYDGYHNTYSSIIGTDSSNHPIFQFAQNANINGYTDWYIPALYEIALFENVAEDQTLTDYQNNPWSPGGSEEISVGSSYWASTGDSCENVGSTTTAAIGSRSNLTTFSTSSGFSKTDTKYVRLIRRKLVT